MSDTTAEDATSTDAETETSTETDATETDAGSDALGAAGKKALDAMKAERNAATQKAKKALAELDQMKAELALKDKPAEEQALEAARAQARTEATQAANSRIVKSELKLAAKGVLADPADALAFIDVSSFDVNDDGEVDVDALNDAITKLIQQKPHLAAGKPNQFQGGGDGGAKPQPKPTASLQEQIDSAMASGDWKRAMSLQNTN
jgi:hypothetical protein